MEPPKWSTFSLHMFGSDPHQPHSILSSHKYNKILKINLNTIIQNNQQTYGDLRGLRLKKKN